MMAPELPSAGPALTRRGRRHADRPTGPRWEAPRASAPGRQRYVLALLLTGEGDPGTLDSGLFRKVRVMLRERVRTTRNLTEIDVWLQSPGGDVHAAYKIALLLRSYASRLRVVVPDHAKGAATLLALAADEIHLAPAAELGPLDAPVDGRGGGRRSSARDVLRTVDEISRTALAFMLHAAEGLRGDGELSRAECVDGAVRLAAELHRPLAQQVHPVDVLGARNALDTAARYADALLSLRAPDATDAEQDDAERSGLGPRHPDTDALVAGFPTRRHVIDLEEAGELGLPVQPLWQYPACDDVQLLHEFVEDRGLPFIEIRASQIDLRALQPAADGTERVAGQGGTAAAPGAQPGGQPGIGSAAAAEERPAAAAADQPRATLVAPRPAPTMAQLAEPVRLHDQDDDDDDEDDEDEDDGALAVAGIEPRPVRAADRMPYVPGR